MCVFLLYGAFLFYDNLLDSNDLVVDHSQQIDTFGQAIKVNSVSIVVQLCGVEHTARHVNHIQMALAVDDPLAAIEEGEAVAFKRVVLVQACASIGDVEAGIVIVGSGLKGVTVVGQHIVVDTRYVVDEA